MRRCDIAVGRNNRTFVGSDEGGRRAAAIYTLIETTNGGSDGLPWLVLQVHPAQVNLFLGPRDKAAAAKLRIVDY